MIHILHGIRDDGSQTTERLAALLCREGLEAKAHKLAMLECGMRALKSAPSVKYPDARTKRRKGTIWGQHKPVRPMMLVYYTCVAGYSIAYVGIVNGWMIAKRLDNGGQTDWRVPNRQRKALSAGLRDALDRITDAWTEAGYDVPWEFSQIDVE